MIFKIISTTDNKFLGIEFEDVFPVVLNGYEFSPDYKPIDLGNKTWRFFNSNYSIEAKET